MKREELVLFYQFRDDEKLALAQKTLHRLGIHTKVLPEEAWREKIGYLLGLKGKSRGLRGRPVRLPARGHGPAAHPQ